MSARVGLVGCGRWGANILRDLVSLKCAVYTTTTSQDRRARALRAGAIEVHDSIDGFPSDLDGLVVATPTSTHYGVVLQLLRKYACPIFVEKPLAPSLDEARKIHEASGGRVFVMDKWRYHPGVELMRQYVTDGRFGRAVGLKTLRVQNGNPHTDCAAAWTYLPHDLAIVREIMGQYPSVRYAVSDGAGDLVTVVLGAHPWSVVEFSSRHFEKRREVRLYFERGTVLLPNETSDSLQTLDLRSQEVRVVPFSPEMPLLRELRGFVEHLHGGPEPKSDTLNGISVASAIERSLSFSVSP